MRLALALALGCRPVALSPIGRGDSGVDSIASGAPELHVGATWWVDVGEVTHPRVAFGADEGARVVFDGGDPAGTWAVDLDAEGRPGDAWRHVEAVPGFSTPDVAWGGDAWHTTARVGGQLTLALDDTPQPVPLGEASPLVFVSAPRVVVTEEGTGVAWWEPGPAESSGTDAYWVAWRWPSGVLEPPVLVAGGAVGSPVAVTREAESWWMAFTDGPAVYLARSVGIRLEAPLRVDQGGLTRPERPALAVDPSGALAVGWRAQDDAQRGEGVRLRLWDPAGSPLTDELALGLDPDRTNRLALASDGGVAVAVWDEGSGEGGDVAAQFFELAEGRALGGPFVIHAERGGTQQRADVALKATERGWTARVAYEDEGRLAVTTITLGEASAARRGRRSQIRVIVPDGETWSPDG